MLARSGHSTVFTKRCLTTQSTCGDHTRDAPDALELAVAARRQPCDQSNPAVHQNTSHLFASSPSSGAASARTGDSSIAWDTERAGKPSASALPRVVESALHQGGKRRARTLRLACPGEHYQVSLCLDVWCARPAAPSLPAETPRLSALFACCLNRRAWAMMLTWRAKRESAEKWRDGCVLWTERET